MANNVAYDPAVIQMFADRLYTTANSLVASYTLLGALVGGGLGGAFGVAVSNSPQVNPDNPELAFFVCAGFGAALLGVVGYAVGQNKAFVLRLQAQLALCQVQTEKNTRINNSNG